MNASVNISVDLERLVDSDDSSDEDDEEENFNEDVSFVIKNYRKEYDQMSFGWKATFNTAVMVELLVSLVIIIAAFKK